MWKVKYNGYSWLCDQSFLRHLCITHWVSLGLCQVCHKFFEIFPYFLTLEHSYYRHPLYHRALFSRQMLIHISISVYYYFCSNFSDGPFYQLFDTTFSCTEHFFSWLPSISSVLLRLRANHAHFSFSFFLLEGEISATWLKQA